MNKFFSKSVVDIKEFTDALEVYEGVPLLDYNSLSENIENNSYQSFKFYVNNDIDFYGYYLNNTEQYHNIKVLDSEFAHNHQIGKDMYGKMLQEDKIIMNFNNLSAKFSLQTGKILEEYFRNNNVKINLQSKIYDEVDDIEEEFNNVYVIFLKNLLEKFGNFFNNTRTENMFISSLMIGLVKIPVFNFDSVLYVSRAALLDSDRTTNCSIVNMMRSVIMTLYKHIKEINSYLKQNTNKALFVSHRRSELKICETNKTFQATLNKTKTLYQEYKADQTILDNIIIFFEYLKDFVAVLLQKHDFENIVDELFTQYSTRLDDYYNQIKN